jgi:ABC-type oligopeptide transport system substrate-binding subunit
MVEFCNECEINSDDEEDFIDTTFEDIFNKNTEEDIFNKNTEEGVNEKILSDAELKIIFNTRVPNWNTYEVNNYGSMCRSTFKF